MSTPMPTTYDDLFKRFGNAAGIPWLFLKVLAWFESGLNPKCVTKGSQATGLLQTVPVVLTDYNKNHGTTYLIEDMTDPETGMVVQMDLLTRILKAYASHHPNSLTPDWTDRRFLELFVAGFNAGYSEAAGVGYVVGKMDAAGIAAPKITIDNVWATAATDKRASKNLRNDAKRLYAHAVVARYLAEAGIAAPASPSSPSAKPVASSPASQTSPTVTGVIFGGALLLLAFVFGRRKRRP